MQIFRTLIYLIIVVLIPLLLQGCPEMVVVPSVVGLPQSEAIAALTNVGLDIDAVTEVYSDTVASGSVISQNPSAGASVGSGSAVTLAVSKGPQYVTVPDVVGIDRPEAETALTDVGLDIGEVTEVFSDTVASGVVISQNPPAGTSVDSGSAVALTVSNGPEHVTVPDVVGLDRAEAEAALTDVGLDIGEVSQVFSDEVAPGTVISQIPTAGAIVDSGSAVALVLSELPEEMPDLGPNASLNGAQVFPADNPWNTRVDSMPVDPNSDAIIDSIGRTDNFHPDFGAFYDGGPFGIPYIVVSGDTPKVPVEFDYADESDPGPYPITDDTPIEGGADSDGDRHMIMIDRDTWTLYELFYAFPPAGAGQPWTAGSGAIFDLDSNDLRPEGWTSADAAGLPIFPGLVRYDEVVEQGEINHAIRFTVRQSRRAYVPPATHYASSNTDPNLPPMGMRVRLKASFDISGFAPNNQVILKAMKEYGLILADNGSDWYFSGAPDARWNDEELGELKGLEGDSFEVVLMEGVVVGK